MRSIYRLFSLLLTGAVFLGCSGKNITLQDYADTWFNETPQTAEADKADKAVKGPRGELIKKKREEPKKNPAADIAWSSTSKADVRNKGKGSLQQKLDKWIEEEWDPAFEGDKDQAKKDKAADEHFTLQHYYDKSQKYLGIKKKEDENRSKEPAHYEKMEALPVIGK